MTSSLIQTDYSKRIKCELSEIHSETTAEEWKEHITITSPPDDSHITGIFHLSTTHVFFSFLFPEKYPWENPVIACQLDPQFESDIDLPQDFDENGIYQFDPGFNISCVSPRALLLSIWSILAEHEETVLNFLSAKE